MARTLNALWILKYTAPVLGPASPGLGRFYNFSATSIDELDGRCADDEDPIRVAARTLVGAQDNKTILYWGFFYPEFSGLMSRASDIVHEARHADLGHWNRVDHVTENCPVVGDSCDQSWNDKGAYMYDTMYLLLFYGDAIETTSAMRFEAGMLAQSKIDNKFVEHPGFNVIF